MKQTSVLDIRGHKEPKPYIEPDSNLSIAADPVVQYLNKEQIEKLIKTTKKQMETAAKDLDFVEAARLRDEMFTLQKQLEEKV
jgi:excinuclease ABC subunit B